MPLPAFPLQWFEDPDGVDSNLHIKPRQLWLICSSVVVGIRWVAGACWQACFAGLMRDLHASSMHCISSALTE